MAPPALLAAVVFLALDAVHPLLGLVWNVAALYLLMGFRRFSHAYTAVEKALKANDLNAARRALAAWRGGATAQLSSGEIAKLAIERGLMDSYRQVFATLFWFTVLPGPAGAVLYRAALLLAEEWRSDPGGADTTPIAQARAAFGGPARALLWLLDWIPARLTALSFAIVGDFEDAAFCWRTQAKAWAAQEGGEHAGIVLASGGGALGVKLGGPLPVVTRRARIPAGARVGRRARRGPPAERGRARLARAGALAAADPAAHARELGAVALVTAARRASRITAPTCEPELDHRGSAAA